MRVAVAAAVLAMMAGCGSGDDRLVVSAAASLTEPLTACSGDDVALSFAGSDELAAQIRQGVRPDVYAAAETALPEALAAEGLVEEPVVFATNELVLAVPATGSRIATIEDLARPGVDVVLGAESVPVGAYTRTVLGRVDPALERDILANVRSEEPDVKGVVGKITQRAADAGFVYGTDVAAAGGQLAAIPLPQDVEPAVAYAAAVVEGAGEDARAYVDGLVAGRCADALGAAGFGPP